jgi:CMP-N-acetylneuraminic acid synthetase|tara:strand:- start:371 stop:496 length:126 start_codon:yes stop_codon:yes gene_type:complete
VNTKILALIPARKGSKRLAKKIGKKTLVKLEILSAQNIKEI